MSQHFMVFIEFKRVLPFEQSGMQINALSWFVALAATYFLHTTKWSYAFLNFRLANEIYPA